MFLVAPFFFVQYFPKVFPPNALLARGVIRSINATLKQTNNNEMGTHINVIITLICVYLLISFLV